MKLRLPAYVAASAVRVLSKSVSSFQPKPVFFQNHPRTSEENIKCSKVVINFSQGSAATLSR